MGVVNLSLSLSSHLPLFFPLLIQYVLCHRQPVSLLQNAFKSARASMQRKRYAAGDGDGGIEAGQRR